MRDLLKKALKIFVHNLLEGLALLNGNYYFR